MKSITDVIKAAAEECKLNFSFGFPSQMADERLIFPLVWLAPTTLENKEGLNEGVLSYGIKLHLLAADKNSPADKKIRMREGLEESVLLLCDSIMKSPCVADVRKLSWTHNTSSLTNYGEIGLTATLKVDKLYCRGELTYCETE